MTRLSKGWRYASRLLDGDGLQARALRGSALTGLSFASENMLRLAGSLVLTRLLFPEAFGLMALIQVVMVGLAMFSDLGIRASIIQDDRGEDPAFLNTAWSVQILRGFLLWAITWALAGPVATFYETPELATMLPVAGFAAVLQGLASTRLAVANRDLALGRLTALQIGSQALGLAGTIGLAFMIRDVWALVWGGLIAPALLTLGSHLLLPGHSDRPEVHRDALRRVIGFGAFILLGSIAHFLSRQADRAILGKFVALETLGLYNIAFFLATVPQLLMYKLVSVVLFPICARRPPGESAANLAAFARARGGIVLASLGLVTLVALLGDWAVQLLYDSRYEAAGALLVLIALAQLPGIAAMDYSPVLLASGDSRRFSVLLVLTAALKTALMLYGAMHYGAFGVALAPALAALAAYPVSVWLVRPYGAWLPWHDLFHMTIACGIAGLALWVHSDLVVEAWDAFVG